MSLERLRRAIHTRPAAILFALSAFTVIMLVGEFLLQAQVRELRARQHLDALAHASHVRGRLERELNAIIYLSSGLGSYLVVRHQNLQGGEINDILSVLHRSGQHVRNFGVAIGYRLSYVYPLQGNEKAIGLYYPDVPTQWPTIQRIVESGRPALAGPLQLVQGGNGLIYRSPLFISGRYWGLLSTVIDSDALFKSLFKEADSRFSLALRGKDALGAQGDVFWGDAALFESADASRLEMEVPGGKWVIAVKAEGAGGTTGQIWLARAFGWPLAALVGWVLYLYLMNRAQLARMAMYDELTGMPNRRLLEDRLAQALARQRRHKGTEGALLFLDLDGFKAVNDVHGHKAGDAVLKVVADRAKRALREEDTVARWGGDEFLLLMEEVKPAQLQALVERLRQEIERPIEFEGHSLWVGASIGLTHFPTDADSCEQLLRLADQRMYAEKIRRKQQSETV